MEPHQKQAIEEMLDDLCQNTTGIDQLLVQLSSKKFITENEADIITSKKTPYLQNKKLFDHIKKKENAMDPLLKSFRETSNGSIADRLEELVKKKQREINKETGEGSEGVDGKKQYQNVYKTDIEGENNKSSFGNMIGKGRSVPEKSADSQNGQGSSKIVVTKIRGKHNSVSGGDMYA